MNWINDIQNAINFIENNLLENIGTDDVSNHIHSSTDYFQRTFNIVTGLSISEYIRNRRLTLAGEELKNTQAKVIDVSMKYGCDSPDSFTKAFTRFHGITPTIARVPNANLKHYHPLSIDIFIRGGFDMKRKLIPNVPVIQYDGNNAGMYTTLVKAMLQSIGDEIDKAKLTALSGEGNRFAWVDGRWYGGCECPHAINDEPFESERRVLSAIGWNAKYITVQRDKEGKYINTDRLQIRKDFISAIDKGFPVIVYLVKQPDCRENIYFGYEDDGNKVICYDYLKDLKHGTLTNNETPVAVDNWEDNIAGYILLQGKEETASERNTALLAFKWISKHARRTTKVGGLYSVGFAAWESWIYLLEHDDFTGLSPEKVWQNFGPHCDAVAQLNERRNALPYYRSLSETFPEWRDELNTAVVALDALVDNLGNMWANEVDEFRNLAVRKRFADSGRELMQKDMMAVEEFEKILKKEGM
jgi:AraC-like DNA-binding protein